MAKPDTTARIAAINLEHQIAKTIAKIRLVSCTAIPVKQVVKPA